MRINPDPYPDLLATLGRTSEQQAKYVEQLASGRRVARPSDDPTASTLMVRTASREASNAEFLHSSSAVQATLKTADSALSSVVAALQRAVTLGVQGANGTVSTDNRQSIAEEVKGIQEQVLSLSNTSFSGSFLFAGTASQSAPFAKDNAGSVQYVGNDSVNSVQIGETRWVKTSMPGSAIFIDHASGVFASLDKLASALSADNGHEIQTATADIRNALSQVSSSRVFYGNTLNQLEAQDAFLNQQQLDCKAEENDLVGADPTEAASALTQAQFSRDAALAAVAKMSMLSLLDYLK